MAIYSEVEYNRRIERQSDKSVVVLFDRVRIVKESVQITSAEADILNMGKLEYDGNVAFTYLLADGEADPQPITKTSQQSGPTGGVDMYGNSTAEKIGPRVIF